MLNGFLDKAIPVPSDTQTGMEGLFRYCRFLCASIPLSSGYSRPDPSQQDCRHFIVFLSITENRNVDGRPTRPSRYSRVGRMVPNRYCGVSLHVPPIEYRQLYTGLSPDGFCAIKYIGVNPWNIFQNAEVHAVFPRLQPGRHDPCYV